MVSAFMPVFNAHKLKRLTLIARSAHSNHDDVVFICCMIMHFPSTVTISQRFLDDNIVCKCQSACLFRILMKDCNLVKWASWPHRL